MNAPAGGQVNSTKAINANLESANNFALWVYVSDAEKLEHLSLYFTSDPTWSRFFYVEINGGAWNSNGYLVWGWNKLVIPKDAFQNYLYESWQNTMIRLRVACDASDGDTVSASFDELRYDYQAKAKCIFTFDDGHASVISLAKPILDSNGQAGVAFIVVDWLGGHGRMAKKDLESLRDAGWDISNHSKSHLGLIDLSPAELDAQVNGGYEWLVNNGFAESARFFGYPFGAFNETVIEKVKENHSLARTVIRGNYQPLIPMQGDAEFTLKIKAVHWETSVDEVKESIDGAIEHGKLLILMFHVIVESDPGAWEYSDDNLKAISDYLRVKEEADEIDVVTFSEYYRQMSHGE